MTAARARIALYGGAITEIYQFGTPFGRPWNLVGAYGVIMVAPCVILVLASQRAIIRGLTRGAVK